ncbi:AAA family ATPase [Parathalassolituus penaei]|uniref:AAA family ATPase n=1 Tax=Parathalassolituus penaei TaxID=2997323 RepID=A0A9X3ISP8_9GAMM|nr:AAA family ATPase [Parathalassolituus penaei]MCY0966637.1 AAA family ATPase [Parathalassolituus penaei]
MKLERLNLENFRCFQRAELELDPQLTVLVAENGQGKSSVLDAIRIGLWSFVSCFDIARNAKADPANGISIADVRMVRMAHGNMARQLPATVSLTGDYGNGEISCWQRYRDKESRSSQTKDRGDARALKQWVADLQDKTRDPDLESQVNLPVFGYYGTGRLWAQKKLTEISKTKNDASDDDVGVRTFAYLNCLDPASSYKHFKEWFIGAFESLREEQIKGLEGQPNAEALTSAKDRVKVVQQAIDCFLRPSTGWHSLEYSVTHDRSLVLSHGDQGVLEVEQLSDGIRSMLAMIGDIAYRCIKLNPHLGVEAARKTEGVVLIDEVDMHLHPRWQQVVVGQLREAFPAIQFVVSTHSPQVLTTVAKRYIRVLAVNDGQISIAEPGFSPLAHESGDALAYIMATHTEPELALKGVVREYELLVRAGQESSPKAQTLWQQLEQEGYQFHESDLTTWRFLAERKKNREG